MSNKKNEESKTDRDDGEDIGGKATDTDKRFQKGRVEYRAVQLQASLLDAEEGQSHLKVLEGRAIAFDTPTPIFQDFDGTQYYEQIHRHALNGVDLSNVVLKYNHSEHVPPLASTKAGTLDLKVNSRGLEVTARMANTTQASDIHELVRTGHLDKMSFAFTVANDAYDSKTRTRTIFKFDKMYDVSVVDFPAYEQTSVSARSYIKAQQETRNLENQRQEAEAEAERERRQAELDAEEAKTREVEEERQRQEREAKEQETLGMKIQEQRQELILKTYV